jgi:Na+/melibiose symporter-like transporter
MAAWEQVLLGIGGLLILFFFWPGAKAAMEKSRQAENPDWAGVFIPVTAVVIFIVLLVMVARS